ncbi:hypothetical protein VTK56DRAFT_7646 [Thermocarpiscus australiensis]
MNVALQRGRKFRQGPGMASSGRRHPASLFCVSSHAEAHNVAPNRLSRSRSFTAFLLRSWRDNIQCWNGRHWADASDNVRAHHALPYAVVFKVSSDTTSYFIGRSCCRSLPSSSRRTSPGRRRPGQSPRLQAMVGEMEVGVGTGFRDSDGRLNRKKAITPAPRFHHARGQGALVGAARILGPAESFDSSLLCTPGQ